jgi:two-component system chemotaxis sensor kinase CheA
MAEKEEEFFKRLRETFKIEAREHLHAISSRLIELEKEQSAEEQTSIIETIFREAHSLKGAARSVNFTAIEAICQPLESVFNGMKNHETRPAADLFDKIHHTIDTIEKILSAPEEVQSSEVSDLIKQLDQIKTGQDILIHPEDVPEYNEEKREKHQLSREKPPVSETIRISTNKLDSLLLQTEEMLSVKLMTSQHEVEVKDVRSMFAPWRKEWQRFSAELRSIQHLLKQRQNGHVTKEFSRLQELLDRNQTFMKSIENKLLKMTKSVEHNKRSVDTMVDNLLEDMKKTLMLPFSSFLDILPKLVRDLSRDQSKDVELVLRGGEIEIDKRIMEEMKDPLIHLLRNCIDHGIEKPEERKRCKKPSSGMITIAISQVDSKVEILVSDDGAGMDMKKVKDAAVKRGSLSQKEAENTNEEEALSLIFQSGLSTSSIVTDISGRGLGLAIVREKVEKLGGMISLETKLHIGTTFRILLPLTLATFRGILVRTADHLFVVPSSNIEKVMRIKQDEIKSVENRETISMKERPLSIVRLDDVLELPRKAKKVEDSVFVNAMVLGSAENHIAFIVDEVIGEYEVLVKGLGKQICRVRNIGAATVLGSGEVVPILNVPDLLKSAVKITGVPVSRAVVSEEETEERRKSILIAEDSITSRMLLKNILESAGYDVRAVVDGAEAFTALKEGDFDLVLSDIQMPKINGFDLTEKIRSDKKLSDIPVVLVTALSSREDRERGIDAGANAYIVKSSFDQSNLLEIIRRLM